DLRALADLMSSADLAAGWRRHRADPRYRLVIAGVFNLLVRTLYRVRVRDIDCGLKLMRREVLEASAPLLARSALLNTELYFKCQRSGLRIRQMAVNHHPRVAGVRSGARLIPILRAVRDLVWLRLRLARYWRAPSLAAPVRESSQRFDSSHLATGWGPSTPALSARGACRAPCRVPRRAAPRRNRSGPSTRRRWPAR